MVSYNRAPWATIKRTHVGALEKGKQHEFVPTTIKIPTFCDYCREIMIGKVIDHCLNYSNNCPSQWVCRNRVCDVRFVRRTSTRSVYSICPTVVG